MGTKPDETDEQDPLLAETVCLDAIDNARTIIKGC